MILAWKEPCGRSGSHEYAIAVVGRVLSSRRYPGGRVALPVAVRVFHVGEHTEWRD